MAEGTRPTWTLSRTCDAWRRGWPPPGAVGRSVKGETHEAKQRVYGRRTGRRRLERVARPGADHTMPARRFPDGGDGRARVRRGYEGQARPRHPAVQGDGQDPRGRRVRPPGGAQGRGQARPRAG